eukprot:366020-Chlamydomonas_euryale.AAC.5
MPAGAGLRKGTRHTFARGFRTKGYIPLTVYLRNFKLGDYVDIKVNAAIHKVQLHMGDAGHGRTAWHSGVGRP